MSSIKLLSVCARREKKKDVEHQSCYLCAHTGLVTLLALSYYNVCPHTTSIYVSSYDQEVHALVSTT